MDITNPFKARLRAGGAVPLGTWLMSGTPSTAEALGHAGFDFLVLDMEHVPIEIGQTADILRAIALTPARALVRLPWNDPVTVKRVLDAGAESIMLPFVQTAEEARAAVSAAKYPPLGTRGVAAVHRSSGYGAATDYLQRANDETCVIVQLETPEALANMAEIAAVPGLDGIFIGPGDMAASMGFIGQIGRAEVQETLADAGRRAGELGIPIGIVGATPEMVGSYIGMGYSFAAIASDLAMMSGRAREVLGALGADAAAAAPAGSSAY
ncbi:2-dehydro-3-deoxyglucarate aldolase (plasmid) [Salipiger profundus]|jgi:4-hydroxy-2-oxoheptanedioate aldolase|uniref:2-dehydro-3-deoxyglucarate aldolase n=1 Tax=Salipiger profundus TaxID=1229727 RepID=A0A1U7DCL5_9RHOB|nr:MULTISPECIES: aldolase/citrate lyase family protein [Salipiger]APX25901.1 2-dehydro-3-deoxyglucarate aldolase [Salipiger profundus]SFC82126.1 2-dehydro-3-deoxyglucarate aldolase [Salipiger profundus]